MSEWSVFWICLFSYWSIKVSVEMLTYNKRQAVKELAADEYERTIDEMVNKKVKEFKNDPDAIREHIEEIINDLRSDE